ncbi:MAG: hypothetical protein ACLPPV_09325 [Candidatus Korobacteraceae bacterium]
MVSSAQMTPAPEKQRKSLVGRLFTWAVIAFVVLVVLVVYAVVNNNYSFHHTSRAEFDAQLNHAIETSTQWIVQQTDIQGNPPLMFMIGDMAEMSGDPRLKSFISAYLASPRVRVPGHPVTWYYAHWADPSVPLPMLTASDVPSLGWQDRWFTYGTAPDRVALPEDDQADMFSPTKYNWGKRLHLQLIALDIYRHYNGPSPRLDAAIIPVTQGVANDAYWDFRVSDSYPQRSAFLLAAGQPELVKKRWIERILDRQNPDGSWNYCWYGWCRGVFEFSLTQEDQGHTTVQAAWALYQLKYRYADWIDQNFK